MIYIRVLFSFLKSKTKLIAKCMGIQKTRTAKQARSHNSEQVKTNILFIVFLLGTFVIKLTSCQPNQTNRHSITEIKKHFADSVAYRTTRDTDENSNLLFKKFVEKYNLPIKEYDYFAQLYYALDVDSSLLLATNNTIRLTAIPFLKQPYVLQIMTTHQRPSNYPTEIKFQLTDGDGPTSGLLYFQNKLYESEQVFSMYSKLLVENKFWKRELTLALDTSKYEVYDPTHYRLEAMINNKYKRIDFTTQNIKNPHIKNMLHSFDSLKQKMYHLKSLQDY